MAISSAGVAGLKPGVIDNAAARPSSPFEGQLVYEKDVDMLAIWNGTEWGYIYSSSGNLLINGAMQVSQRSGVGTAVTGITSTGYYTADRFESSISSFGTWSQTNIAEAPTGSGFVNSLKMVCTTAVASLTGNVYANIIQKIEGQNCQAIRKGTSSAQTLTFSFWVKAGIAGTYIVDLFDSNSRQVSKAYTVAAINVWEYKTIVIPADISGVIPNTNGSGLAVRWWLGAGTSYTSGTLNTSWNTITNANIAVGQTNVAAGTNAAVNYWQMTGAQLTIGSAAVPFQFKSYGQELHECMRYFQLYPYGQYQEMPVAIGYAPANYYYGAQDMRVPYRAAPTVTITSLQWRNPGTAGLSAGTAAYYNANNDGAYFAFAAASGGYNALSFFIGSTQTAEL